MRAILYPMSEAPAPDNYYYGANLLKNADTNINILNTVFQKYNSFKIFISAMKLS